MYTADIESLLNNANDNFHAKGARKKGKHIGKSSAAYNKQGRIMLRERTHRENRHITMQ